MCTSGKVSNSVTQMSIYCPPLPLVDKMLSLFHRCWVLYLLMTVSTVASLSPLAHIGSGDNEYGNLACGIWSRCQRVKVKSLVEQDMGGWTVEFALSTSSPPECCTKETGYFCWTSIDFWCLFLQDYSRSRNSCCHAWSWHKGWQWASTILLGSAAAPFNHFDFLSSDPCSHTYKTLICWNNPFRCGIYRNLYSIILKYQSFLNIGPEGDYVRRPKVSI